MRKVKTKLGRRLTPQEQGAVVQSMKPRNANRQDWLSHTRFRVTQSGRLDRRIRRPVKQAAPGTQRELFQMRHAIRRIIRRMREIT